jgi:hypothetical protein
MKKAKKELKRDKLIRQAMDIILKSKPEDFKYLTTTGHGASECRNIYKSQS